MEKFVLLIDGERKDIRRYDERPTDIPHKGVVWLPLVYETGNEFEGVDGDRYVIRTPDPASLPPTVPDVVSPRQARLALLAIGKLDAANAVVESAGDVVKVAWEFSSYVRRDDPGVASIGSAIGLDSKALDSLFIEAAKL